MKNFLMSILTLGAISSSAYAACTPAGCYDVTVDKIFATDAGVIWISTSGDESQLNCTLVGGSSMTLADSVGKNAIYSYLLTQKTTKGKINIRVKEGSSNCEIAYVY